MLALFTLSAAFAKPPELGSPLDPDALIRAVVEVHPEIAAGTAGANAAHARERAAGPFPSPRVSWDVAPLSLAGDVEFGQAVSLEAAIPYAGERRFAREMATADADAADWAVRETALEMVGMAFMGWLDLWHYDRALEVNEKHGALLDALGKAARGRYDAGKTGLAAPLQADVERAHVDHDRLKLQASRAEVLIRLNALLGRPSDAPLPAPAGDLPLVALGPLDPATAWEACLPKRPDVLESRAMERAAEAGVDMARRDRLPMLMAMTSWSSMWMDLEHRWMVGAEVEIPVGGSRRAALDAAGFERDRAAAMRAATENGVREEVADAIARLIEAHHEAELNRDRLVPAARRALDAATAGFEAGMHGFDEVLMAARMQREAELMYHDSIAMLHARVGQLDMACGEWPRVRKEGVL